jgi:hypothetical protein
MGAASGVLESASSAIPVVTGAVAMGAMARTCGDVLVSREETRTEQTRREGVIADNRSKEALADGLQVCVHQIKSKLAAQLAASKIEALIQSKGQMYKVRVKVIHDELVFSSKPRND